MNTARRRRAVRVTLIPAERWGLRLSVHAFRWGVHWKLRRRSDVWHHFLLKAAHGSAFGGKRRRMLVVLAWTSRKGTRGPISCGWRFLVAADRLGGLQPRETLRIPGYPNRPRERRSEA